MSNSIIQDFINEVWVPVVIKDLPRKPRRTKDLFISNYGRIKSISIKTGKQTLIKGSIQEGYPCLRLRIYIEPDIHSPVYIEYKNLLADNKLFTQKLSLLEEELIHVDDALHYERLITQINKYKIKIKELEKPLKKLAKQHKKEVLFSKTILVHRFVAEHFCERPSIEHNFVIHKNFVKSSNHYENLQWCTLEEQLAHLEKNPNFIEAIERGKTIKRNYKTKLTSTQVIFIKRLLSEGKTLSSIAKRFGVSDMQIHRIKTGENWASVGVSKSE